jgi:GNAT superfamily N-acetyltransferase
MVSAQHLDYRQLYLDYRQLTNGGWRLAVGGCRLAAGEIWPLAVGGWPSAAGLIKSLILFNMKGEEKTAKDMTTRPATPEEAPDLAKLISLAYRVEDFFKIGDRTDAEDVRGRMQDGVFLVLEDAGVLAGCVYVKRHEDIGYFGMLSIDPARQGQGLGKRLIADAEQFCRDAGCQVMELEVVNLRTELPPFYRRFGYIEAGTRPFPDHERAKLPCYFIVMSKPLR